MRLTCPRAPGQDQSPLLWGPPPASSPGRPQALPSQPQGELPVAPRVPLTPSPTSEGLMLYAQPGVVRGGTLESVPASQGVVRAGVGFPSPAPSPSPSLCLRGLCSPRNVWRLACVGDGVGCLGPWPGIGGGNGAAPTPSQPSVWGEKLRPVLQRRDLPRSGPPAQDLPHLTPCSTVWLSA